MRPRRLGHHSQRPSVAQGLAGLECLSGIPGLVGATPIQNVGAYGQEISDTVVSVRAYDLTEGREVSLTAAECQFGYRDSAFKSVFPGRFVVLEVTFALRNGAPRLPAYKELSLALASESPSVERVREVVLALRRAKGMVVDPSDADSKSAGSFFTNPLLDDAAVERLRARLGATTLPTFPGGAGRTKVPAAFLIERAGFSKGTERGTARISRKHALALVNVGGSAAAVLALAREIRDAVQERFDVRLEPEPVLVGFSKTGALEW